METRKIKPEPGADKMDMENKFTKRYATKKCTTTQIVTKCPTDKPDKNGVLRDTEV
jgi:hypothetical protein